MIPHFFWEWQVTRLFTKVPTFWSTAIFGRWILFGCGDGSKPWPNIKIAVVLWMSTPQIWYHLVS
jgi:hypothetical protein